MRKFAGIYSASVQHTKRFKMGAWKKPFTGHSSQCGLQKEIPAMLIMLHNSAAWKVLLWLQGSGIILVMWAEDCGIAVPMLAMECVWLQIICFLKVVAGRTFKATDICCLLAHINPAVATCTCKNPLSYFMQTMSTATRCCKEYDLSCLPF